MNQFHQVQTEVRKSCRAALFLHFCLGHESNSFGKKINFTLKDIENSACLKDCRAQRLLLFVRVSDGARVGEVDRRGRQAADKPVGC